MQDGPQYNDQPYALEEAYRNLELNTSLQRTLASGIGNYSYEGHGHGQLGLENTQIYMWIAPD